MLRARLLLATLLLACAHPNAVSAPAATPSRADTERSVRPGANKEYLSPTLQVEAWEARFERGGREIFDRRDDIVRAAGVRPGMTVADVGAGTELFTELFARAVGPEGRVLAVDLAPKFLAHIDQRARAAGLTQIKTIRGDERIAPLPPSSVDVVFLCDAYHHFEYPRAMNASLWRALRPGGRLVLIDFERVPGRSAAWILDHVRAGKEVFTAELKAAGFEPVGETKLLTENYFLTFKKPGP